MTHTQIFYQKLDSFLDAKVEKGLLLKHENKTISIDSKCEGGCIFSEFEFGILKEGEITIFWESKPEFWKDSDVDQNTDLFSDELETEVKSMIRKYLDRELYKGIEEDMADLISEQKKEARKFKDN